MSETEKLVERLVKGSRVLSAMEPEQMETPRYIGWFLEWQKLLFEYERLDRKAEEPPQALPSHQSVLFWVPD